jgi:hypothetical protein
MAVVYAKVENIVGGRSDQTDSCDMVCWGVIDR